MTYIKPLGLDPFLQGAPYTHKVCTLTGFSGRVRTGYYGHGRQIPAVAVIGSLTAVGTTIALATGSNPLKLSGEATNLFHG